MTSSDSNIALLRGINVGGHNKIAMSDLRSLCADVGWKHVRSYIQSGNLVFTAGGSTSDLEDDLEVAIKRVFGLSIPVIVRRAEDWQDYIEGNPFPAASVDEPNRVLLALSKSAPPPHTAKQLLERATGNEKIIQVNDTVWTHIPDGIAKSKLTPKFLDRVFGSPVTTRNWRTVLKLAELAALADADRKA